MVSSRARQFLPFASLKGYFELLRQQEQVFQPASEPAEDYYAALNRRACQLKPGRAVKILYYEAGGPRVVKTIFKGFAKERGLLLTEAGAIALAAIRELEAL